MGWWIAAGAVAVFFVVTMFGENIWTFFTPRKWDSGNSSEWDGKNLLFFLVFVGLFVALVLGVFGAGGGGGGCYDSTPGFVGGNYCD